MGDYEALQRIQAPGTLVTAYMPGDPISADVVNEWGLNDEQVSKYDSYEPPRPEEDSDDRNGWELYVVGQGTSKEDAKAASLDELRNMYDPPPPEETPAWQINDARETQMRVEAAASSATPAGATVPPAGEQPSDRPATSATKAEWVKFVEAHGADKEWAEASSTTKDDLQNWQG